MSQDFWSLSASPFGLLFCVIIHLPVRLSNVECRHIACRNIMSNHPDDDHILPPEELPCSSLEKQWGCKQFQRPTGLMDNPKHKNSWTWKNDIKASGHEGSLLVVFLGFWWGTSQNKSQRRATWQKFCMKLPNIENCSECFATLFLALVEETSRDIKRSKTARDDQSMTTNIMGSWVLMVCLGQRPRATGRSDLRLLSPVVSCVSLLSHHSHPKLLSEALEMQTR